MALVEVGTVEGAVVGTVLLDAELLALLGNVEEGTASEVLGADADVG